MKKRTILVVGDVVALAVITLIGFATHNEVGIAFLPRMMTTFLPLMAGWFLIAPWLGLFDLKRVSGPRQIWRVPLAMLFAAPLTGVLRAAMLGGVALPLFVLILGGSAALGMLTWRGIWLFIQRRL